MEGEKPEENKIMQGHPAQDAGDPFKEERPQGEAQPEPKGTRKINVGGRDVELPEDTAAAIESYSQTVQQQMQQLQSQNQQLYNYLTEKEVNQGQQSQTSNSDDVDENLLYDNPKEFIRKIEERVASRVGNTKKEVLSEVQQRSTTEKQLKEFWDGFWKQNTDLDPNRDSVIVNSVFNQKAQDWGSQNLTFGQVQDKLANEARQIIARYRGQSEDDGEPGGNFSETPSSNSRARGKAQPKQKEQKDQAFSSATDLLKNIRNKKGIV